MFLTVRTTTTKNNNPAAVIWAKNVIAWCAASCVRCHSQLQSEQLWRRGEACQISRVLQVRFTKPKSHGVVNSNSKAKEPINRFLITWMLLHTEHFSVPSVCSQQCLSCCGGHEICPLRCLPVETSLPVTAFIHPNLLALTSAVVNSHNSSSSPLKMLHEIT